MRMLIDIVYSDQFTDVETGLRTNLEKAKHKPVCEPECVIFFILGLNSLANMTDMGYLNEGSTSCEHDAIGRLPLWSHTLDIRSR